MPRIIYVTAADLVQYAADRGVLVTEDAARIAVTQAQDYIDNTYSFYGTAVYPESEFPRSGLELYPDTVVPEPVHRATLQVALMILKDVPIQEGALAAPQVKREVVATNKIETEYATNYKAAPVQNSVILPSLLRLFDRYLLLDASSVTCVNLFGVRG